MREKNEIGEKQSSLGNDKEKNTTTHKAVFFFNLVHTFDEVIAIAHD